MPVHGSSVVVPQGKEFELLPKDVYQCELTDIKLEQGTKWQSTEVENKLVFIFTVIDEGEHYGRNIWQYCTEKLSKFNGGSNLYKVLVGLNGGKDLEESQMDNIAEVASDSALNAHIHKQVRLSIGQKMKEDGKTPKNIIESFLPIKQELPAYVKREDTATPDEISFDA